MEEDFGKYGKPDYSNGITSYKYNDTEFYAMYHPSQWTYRFKGIGKN